MRKKSFDSAFTKVAVTLTIPYFYKPFTDDSRTCAYSVGDILLSNRIDSYRYDSQRQSARRERFRNTCSLVRSMCLPSGQESDICLVQLQCSESVLCILRFIQYNCELSTDHGIKQQIFFRFLTIEFTDGQCNIHCDDERSKHR